MKRTMSLLLVLATVLSLLTACGGSGEETARSQKAAAAVETTAEPTADPTTQPTLSPEEILYNSLTERQRQAVDAGIVELSQLEDLKHAMTVGEASQILQQAYLFRCGVESKTLNDLMTNETYSSREANIWWMSGVIALADMELIYGDRYEDYEQWWSLCKNELFTVNTYCDMKFLNFSETYLDHYESENSYAAMTRGDMLYAACGFWSGSLGDYAYSIYDQTNGLKVLDEEKAIREDLLAQVSLEEVVEFSLRYANSAVPVPDPEWVEPENADGYDTSIITPELLEKETGLPSASCAQLPSSWHGIVMDDLCDLELTATNGDGPNREVFEYEIQAIKDAGFNFIGLNINFSLLQGWDYSDLTYYDFDGNGALDENRLKELDQILAWCMEYDIHLNIRAAGMPGCTSERDHESKWKKSGAAEEFAAIWQALARRYADIPNEYLSFTLYSGEYGINTAFLTPVVEAIRGETADRCIIAEIGNGDISPETFAEMGVALSYKFGAAHSELFDKWSGITNQESSAANFTWPYHGTLDGQTLLDGKLYQNGPSANDVIAVAREYGVGFMLSGFGIHTGTASGPSDYVTVRFPDEAYHAMITDITSTVESLGYSWCFAHWYGTYGLSFGTPVVESTTYRQIENYPCYIDQTILGWFREINGEA